MRFCKIALFGCLELVRDKGFYFWQKPKVAKTFKILRCKIEGNCRICGGFCKFVDSALDSTNPQNPHKKHKMDGCVVLLFGVGKRERTLLFAKAKSSKNF